MKEQSVLFLKLLLSIMNYYNVTVPRVSLRRKILNIAVYMERITELDNDI